ncbi:GMP reductase [Buchnera aphidicola]|uniref:GMP reductase n=1 Tax=Buchnera aphidicola (Sarucallis kahawaluokalani) TaxID=1241878 RepID=A0A4D6YK07_9GAMM|nr:GMP reductase [Buchnera aphidicola]QCI26190.1 GMP reductase [Buchnera aphidicola (Sarucallis kahawaluokalani)]
MRIEEGIKLGFKDVLILPKRSALKSRSEVSLCKKIHFKYSNVCWSGIPIIASNMDTVGTFNMAHVLSEFHIFTAIHKYYNIQQWKEFILHIPKKKLHYVMISTGISDLDYMKLKQIIALSPLLQYICIDVANGYSEYLIDFIKKIRSKFPDKVICSGNVVTGEMVEALLLAGSDIVKVGIGPGSVCTTRLKTGVGYPQLSAIIECADAAHGLKGHIISDGGCINSGDIAKAFGAGADFVMLGGIFAGHNECEGEIIQDNGKKFMIFYGMSSKNAMKLHMGKIDKYKTDEGKSVKLLFKGSVYNTVLDILGGLRSTCTYIGAQGIHELTKRTTFIRVLEQENKVFNNSNLF